MERQMTTFCNQARVLMEGWGHKCIHKTFYPKSVLLIRCAGIKEVERKLRKWPTIHWQNLRLMS